MIQDKNSRVSKITMKKQFVATGFVLLSFLFPLKAKATMFDRLYVFGNSLSDNGNFFNLTTAANKLDPTIPISPPSPPYYQGRFSNGPIWLDEIAPQLGLTTPLIPATKLAVGGPIILTPSGPTINFNYGGATTTNNVDFAFGGAETGLKSNDARVPIGLLTEVNSYTGDLTKAQQSADPNALYVVEAGANDFLDQANAGNQFDTQEAIANLQTAVTELYAKGARNFLISNLSDLGKTPFALSRGSAESAILTEVTDEYNAGLVTLLNSLSNNTGINIIPLEVDSLFNQITANPTAFGLTNVTDACLTTNPVSICANPNQYFFWDDVHPTAPVQTILANAALAKLNSVSVPEPASALDILAFAALGASLKLKRQRQKARVVDGGKIPPLQ